MSNWKKKKKKSDVGGKSGTLERTFAERERKPETFFSEVMLTIFLFSFCWIMVKMTGSRG